MKVDMMSKAAKMLSALCLLGIALSCVSAAPFGPGSGMIPVGAASAELCAHQTV